MITEQEIFSKAVAFAAEKHKTQTRKDGSPYIYHPLKVAELLKEAGYGVDYQIAAVLHDTLEDTDATEDEIRAFGKDVFEAVHLVTRPEGMPEEEYVAAILENRMASAVKNADKIHNMLDVMRCEDREWAKNYAEKVKKYYHGKFSSVLDKVITEVSWNTTRANAVVSKFFYSKSDMELYSDRNKRRYDEAKEWYINNTEAPDFDNPHMEYWYDDFIKFYFCYSEYGEFWGLTIAGWSKISFNPFNDDEYGTYMSRIDRERVDEEIKRMKDNDGFYDFVDVTKL